MSAKKLIRKHKYEIGPHFVKEWGLRSWKKKNYQKINEGKAQLVAIYAIGWQRRSSG